MVYGSVNHPGNLVEFIGYKKKRSPDNYREPFLYDRLTYLENVISITHIIQTTNRRASVARSCIVINNISTTNT